MAISSPCLGPHGWQRGQRGWSRQSVWWHAVGCMMTGSAGGRVGGLSLTTVTYSSSAGEGLGNMPS